MLSKRVLSLRFASSSSATCSDCVVSDPGGHDDGDVLKGRMLHALLSFLSIISKTQKPEDTFHTHTHTQPYRPAFLHRIPTPHSHTAQANHPSSTISSHHTSITMSASNSAAKAQETQEFECKVEAHDVDKDCERPWVEVETSDGRFFPTTDGQHHVPFGGARMKIYVQHNSKYAHVHMEVRVICSRDKGSEKPWSVTLRSKK